MDYGYHNNIKAYHYSLQYIQNLYTLTSVTNTNNEWLNTVVSLAVQVKV